MALFPAWGKMFWATQTISAMLSIATTMYIAATHNITHSPSRSTILRGERGRNGNPGNQADTWTQSIQAQWYCRQSSSKNWYQIMTNTLGGGRRGSLYIYSCCMVVVMFLPNLKHISPATLVQISIYQKKVLSELYRPITISRSVWPSLVRKLRKFFHNHFNWAKIKNCRY